MRENIKQIISNIFGINKNTDIPSQQYTSDDDSPKVNINSRGFVEIIIGAIDGDQQPTEDENDKLISLAEEIFELSFSGQREDIEIHRKKEIEFRERVLPGLAEIIIERAYIKTKAKAQIYWDYSPSVELIASSNNKRAQLVVTYGTSQDKQEFKSSQLPHHIDDHILEENIFDNVFDDEFKTIETIKTAEEIYLTLSNPLQFRSALTNVLVSRWQSSFELYLSNEIDAVVDFIDRGITNPIAEVGYGNTRTSNGQKIESKRHLIDDFLSYIKFSKNSQRIMRSGDKYGFSGIKANQLIDDVYSTIDLTVLKLAAQHFGRLTWESYDSALVYESEVNSSLQKHRGMASLYYPSNFFVSDIKGSLNYSEGEFEHTRVQELQRSFLAHLWNEKKTCELIERANPRYLFKMITSLVDRLDLSVKRYSDLIINCCEHSRPFLPSESLITTCPSFRRLMKCQNSDATIFNITKAVNAFSSLPKNKRNDASLIGFCNEICQLAINTEEVFLTEESTKVQANKIINSLKNKILDNSLIKESNETFVFKKLIEFLPGSIEHSGIHWRLENIHYEPEKYDDAAKILVVDLISGKGKKELLVSMRITSSDIFSDQITSSMDKALCLNDLEVKISKLVSENVLTCAITTGKNVNLAIDEILGNSTWSDTIFKKSSNGFSVAQSFSLIRSASINGRYSIANALTKSMKDPLSINSRGVSVVDIVISSNDNTALINVCETLQEMGTSTSFFRRSLDTALSTYRPETVAILLGYSRGLSIDQANTLNGWGPSRSESLIIAQSSAQLFEDIKNAKNIISQKICAPSLNLTSLDIL